MKRSLMILAAAVVFVGGTGVGWLLPRREAAPSVTAGGEVSHYQHTLTLATYNTRNLFDEHDNPYTADEKSPSKSPGDVAELARAIRQLDADVLVLQEVEAGGVLKTFVANQLADMRYEYVVDASTEDPRGITVAALSRVPVNRIVSHRLSPLEGGRRFARDLLRLDLEPSPGHSISVYGMHLKSKRSSEDDGDKNGARWRLAEAVRARGLIREEMSAFGGLDSARFVIMGDANDALESPPVQTLLSTTEPPLVDALADIPAADRITFRNNSYREAIDQVLLSPRLAREVVSGSAAILEGGPYEKASDHRPIRFTLRIP